MAHRTSYRLKITARKRARNQTRANIGIYPEPAEEDTELPLELDEEGRELMKRTYKDLEENLPHAKKEYMGHLEIHPVVSRKEPDDKVFITKINLRRDKAQNEIPECVCLCHSGSNLVIWKAKRRRMGTTHARVLVPDVEQI